MFIVFVHLNNNRRSTWTHYSESKLTILHSYSLVLNLAGKEARSTNCIVFLLSRPGLEPMILAHYRCGCSTYNRGLKCKMMIKYIT